MPFEKALPEWNATGIEPPQSLKDMGWAAEQKPPADYFNWFFHQVYNALKELQEEGYTQEEIDGMLSSFQSNLAGHSTAKNNPHGVTKSQVGLGNVDNVKQASKAEFDAHNADSIKHITAAERTKWNSALSELNYTPTDVLAKLKTVDGTGSGLDADLLDGKHASEFATSDHSHNNANQSQSGFMSNVDKTKLDGIVIATQAEAEAGTSSSKYMTPQRTAQAIQKLAPTPDLSGLATKTEVNAHLADEEKHLKTGERTIWNGKIDSSEKGQPNGIPTLDDTGKILESFMPNGIAKTVTGSFVGSGGTKNIVLGFQPSIVLSYGSYGSSSNELAYRSEITSRGAITSNATNTVQKDSTTKTNDTGFTVANWANSSNHTYYYVAFE